MNKEIQHEINAEVCVKCNQKYWEICKGFCVSEIGYDNHTSLFGCATAIALYKEKLDRRVRNGI